LFTRYEMKGEKSFKWVQDELSFSHSLVGFVPRCYTVDLWLFYTGPVGPLKISHLHGSLRLITVMLFCGENPQAVTYSAQPLCWRGWERWSRNTLPRVFYVLCFFLNPPLFLTVHWKWQHHLTWSPTHDIVSWEIKPMTVCPCLLIRVQHVTSFMHALI